MIFNAKGAKVISLRDFFLFFSNLYRVKYIFLSDI